MRKSLFLIIFIICLALTACRKEQPLESLEVAETETKSKFDISEDFEAFVDMENCKSTNFAISAMNEGERIAVEESTENIGIDHEQEQEQEVKECLNTLHTDNENSEIVAQTMPQQLKNIINEQNEKEVQEGLALINAYLESSQTDN